MLSKMRVRSPRSLLLAVFFGLSLGGCTSDDFKDFLHVSGKVAYDTLKNAGGSHHERP